MISDELRAEAKGLTDQISGGQTAFHKLTYKLLAAIDAHECPVSGGVSEELRRDALALSGLLEAPMPLIPHTASKTIQDLLAMADAQPGWIEGPPKEPGKYRIVRGDGTQYPARYFTKLDFSTPWTKSIQWHERVIPPPKQEPVVDRCEEDGTRLADLSVKEFGKLIMPIIKDELGRL